MDHPSATGLRCEQCSAPLEFTGSPIVTCRYCGMQNQVKVPSPPAPPAPRWPQVEASVMPAVVSARTSAWRVVGLVVSVMVLAGVISTFMLSHGSIVFSNESRFFGTIGSLCELDANGDQKPDLVSIFATMDQPSLAAIDGTTQQVLWKLPVTSDDHLFCSVGAVVISHPAFKVEIVDNFGRSTYSAVLSDKLDSVASAAGCFRLNSADKRAVMVYLGGTIKTCAPTFTFPTPNSNFDADRVGIRVGDVVVHAEAIGPGTARLGLNGQREGRRVWSRTLLIEHSIIWTEMALVPSRDGIVVAGHRPGDKLAFRLMHIRAIDGAVLFDQALPVEPKSVSPTIWEVTVSEQRIYVRMDHTHVFNLSDGTHLWQL